MILAQTVTKNSLYSLSSSIVQKLLTLVYFIVVARAFGPEDQGRYSAAIAFAALFSVLIDLGLSSALTRETSRTPERAKEFLGQMFLLRIVLGVCVYGLIVFSSFLFGYSSELIALIQIAGIASVIDTITTSCWFLLRGFRNLLYESIGSVAAIITMMIAGIGSLIFHLPVSALVYAVLFGSVMNLAFSLFTVFFRARIPLNMRPDKTILRYLVIVSLPFAGAAIFSRIYTFADVTILARIAGDHAVGWYSAGNKLVLALSIIPGSLSASVYPALSSYALSAPEKLSALTAKALFFLFLIAAPIGAGIMIAAGPIVSLFYGSEYLPTIPILQVLGISIIFGFLSFPFGALLAAVNRQHMNTIIFGIAAFVSVVGNVLLVIRYGAFGSALASVATTVVIVLCSAFAVREILKGYWKTFIYKGCAIIGCAGSMALVLWLMRLRGAELGVLIFAGVCVYAACILLTRTITIKELAEVRDSILKK